MDVSASLFGFSKALYSNWLFYKPDALLIDCGEGCATSLGNNSYAIERVLLTHGHIDHIAGLPSLIWARAAGMGDNNKPLAIYHPRDDGYIADMRAYLERTKARLPFELTWIELDAGSSVPLLEEGRHTRRVETFATEHIHGRLTLGYNIIETRRRLKPEFASLSQEELRERARELGRDASQHFSEEYDAILVAFGGDGLPVRAEDVRGSEILVHEATILDSADRKHQLHSTVEEAVAVAVEAAPRALLLNHFSGRYRRSEIQTAVVKAAKNHEVDFPIWCLVRDRLWNATAETDK
ncbi:MAG TPA: MBL fold metallo-hydrolase [Abditibacteriaceae bacterium]